MNFEYTGYSENILSKLGTGCSTTPALPEDIAPLISSFPKTRYYGSKRRLLDWIYHAVKDLPFNSVLDGFGGTASVSLLFKMMGKEVTFHDGLLCNTIIAHALLADNVADVVNRMQSSRPDCECLLTRPANGGRSMHDG